ncbi:UNKNOWN [Stylonychia lemnae]|uniref:Uncharacterized protein n=1 Tax=Stylonychia lemnae TaxID=5949 RepID=A0A078B0D9_STYLE|nr:UNKNOWN [Stylonychia lemnae]|eukprot:CDW86862.1 UNKNOWN [Stylonychia lemnae]
MDKQAIDSLNLIEWNQQRTQKRYGSVKRVKLRSDYKTRKQTPSQRTYFQEINKVCEDLNLSGCNTTKHYIESKSNMNNSSGSQIANKAAPNMYQKLEPNINITLAENQPNSVSRYESTGNNELPKMETASKLEKLIKDMLSKGGEQQLLANKQISIKVEDQNVQSLCQDAVNLSNYLDIQIQSENQQQESLSFKEEPKISDNMVLEKTLQAQRIDILALQEIEKSKQELEKRIKERYTVLRSISRKTNTKKPTIITQNQPLMPKELIMLNQRVQSISHVRQTSIKYDFHPYQQNLNIASFGSSSSKMKKIKRHNKTTLINPINNEQHNGRLSSLYGNLTLKDKSPTVLSKTSTMNNNNASLIYDPIQAQASIISAKKVNKLQKKKIVIQDNFNFSLKESIMRDITPINDSANRYFEPMISISRVGTGNHSQLRQRPQRMPNQQNSLRCASSTMRHARTRSGQVPQIYLRKQNFQRNETNLKSQNHKIASLSPASNNEMNDNLRADSVPLDSQFEHKFPHLKNLMPQNLQSDEYDINRAKLNESKRELRSKQNLNVRQKLNFRYIPGEDNIHQQYTTVNSEKEQEDRAFCKDLDKSQQMNETKTKIEIHIQDENQFLITQDVNLPMRESAFNTPSHQNPDFVFQSNILNTKNKRFKNVWRDQADTDSAGLSKTTLSTQRPLLSGGINLVNALQYQQNGNQKPTSKMKMVSYQKGRFSSDCSFIKLRQTIQNAQKHSTAIDGEDSQCKFEDPDKEEVKAEKISQDSVVQINEEEEYIEDEDSKKSIKKPLKPLKTHSSSHKNTSGKNQPTSSMKNHSIYEDSQCNILSSHHSCKNEQFNENMNNNQLHSDDEIEIRRGLESSTHRSLNPKEPEFLRQSTHSLLGKNRGNTLAGKKPSGNNIMISQDEGYANDNNEDDDIYERVELYNDSYESYLKNADNFIKL